MGEFFNEIAREKSTVWLNFFTMNFNLLELLLEKMKKERRDERRDERREKFECVGEHMSCFFQHSIRNTVQLFMETNGGQERKGE